MLNRIFNICSSLSLLLCVAMTILCIVSFWIGMNIEWIQWENNKKPSEFRGLATIRSIGIGRGGLSFNYNRTIDTADLGINVFTGNENSAIPEGSRIRMSLIYDVTYANFPGHPSRLGFYFGNKETDNIFGGSIIHLNLCIPILCIIAMFAAAPAFSAIQSRIISKRRGRGLCLKCGYDLRASKYRCPECGTFMAPKSTSG